MKKQVKKYSYMYDSIPKEIEVTNFISKNVVHQIQYKQEEEKKEL